MKDQVLSAVEDGIRAIECLKKPSSLLFIEASAKKIADCFRAGGKILIAGNGGSLCDAMHFAEELTGVFRNERPALPAIALSDPGHLTCVGNDLGYDKVFARGVEALGKKDDIFIGLTTSGKSSNIIQGVFAAKEKGLSTIAFLGKTGGPLLGTCDLELLIEGFTYSDRIQEAHMTAIHIIIEMVENLLFAPETQNMASALTYVS